MALYDEFEMQLDGTPVFAKQINSEWSFSGVWYFPCASRGLKSPSGLLPEKQDGLAGLENFRFMLPHSLFLRIQFRYRRLSFYSQIILNRAKQDFSLRMGGCLLPILHSLSHV